MHHAGIQYGQAPMSATAHPQFNNVAELSVPSAAPSTTASLRQWRKKEGVVAAGVVPEIKQPSLQSEPSGENQGPIARVAPHAHYPRPNEPFRYPQQQQQQPTPYENYGLGYKEPAPVKYSEIVEPVQAPPHRIEHAPLQVQKPKEKEYLEMCSMQQQMKHGYAMLPQYNMQKESQMYIPNYHLQNCKIPPNYHQRQYGNDGFHLALYERQEQQLYMEQQRVAYQNQRMYRPQFHPNYRTQYNYSNYKPPNIQGDPYRMHPYQQMQNYKIPPHLDAARNLSPRRVYHETYPRVSPNYNQCSQLEYAQHYQNRRQIPTDYLTHQQMQNHQMPDLVTDATPKSSLKQFLETWNDDIPEIQDGTKKDDNLYILDSTEIPTESIQQFIHLQVDKLPENIKGFIGPSTSTTTQGVIRENEVLNLTQDTVIRSQQPSVISETKKFLEVESQKLGNAALDLLQNTVIVYNENSEKSEGVIKENFKKIDNQLEAPTSATDFIKSNISKEAMPSLQETVPTAQVQTVPSAPTIPTSNDVPETAVSLSIVAAKCASTSTTILSEREATTVLRETGRTEDMPSRCLADMPPIEEPLENLAEVSEIQFPNNSQPTDDTDSLTGRDSKKSSTEKEKLLDDAEKFLNKERDNAQEDKILDYTRETLLSDTRGKLPEYSPDIPEILEEVKKMGNGNEKIIEDAEEKIIRESIEIIGDAAEKIKGFRKEEIVDDGKDLEADRNERILVPTRETLLDNIKETLVETKGEDNEKTQNSEQQLSENNISLNSKATLAEVEEEKSNLVEEVFDASSNKNTIENNIPEGLEKSAEVSSTKLKADVKLTEAHIITPLRSEVEVLKSPKIDDTNSQPAKEIKEIPRSVEIEQKCNARHKVEDKNVLTNDLTDSEEEIRTLKRGMSGTSIKATGASRISIDESTSEESMDTSTSGEDTSDLTSFDESSCSPASDGCNPTQSVVQKQFLSRESVSSEKDFNAEKDVNISSNETLFPKSAFSSVTSSATEKVIAVSYLEASSNIEATSPSASSDKDNSTFSKLSEVQNLGAITTNSLPITKDLIETGTEPVSAKTLLSESVRQAVNFPNFSEPSNKSMPIKYSNKSPTFIRQTEVLVNVPSISSESSEDTPDLGDNSENNKEKCTEDTQECNNRNLYVEPENKKDTFAEQELKNTREKSRKNTKNEFLDDPSKKMHTEDLRGTILDDTKEKLLDDTREKNEKREIFKDFRAENVSRNLLEDTEKNLLEESTRAFNCEREELLKESKRVRFISEEIVSFSREETEENKESCIARSKDLSRKPEEIEEKKLNTTKGYQKEENLEDDKYASCKEIVVNFNGVLEEKIEKKTNKLLAQEAEDKQSKTVKHEIQHIEIANEVHALNLSTKNLKYFEEQQNVDTQNNLKSVQQESASQFVEESKQDEESTNTNKIDEFEENLDSEIIAKHVEENPKADTTEEPKQLVTNETEAFETMETNEENITCANALAVDENYVLLQIGGEILEINVINTMGRKIISVVPFTDCTVVTENNNEEGIVNLEGEDVQEVLFVEEGSQNKEVNEINLEEGKVQLVDHEESKIEEKSNACERNTILVEEKLNKSEEESAETYKDNTFQKQDQANLKQQDKQEDSVMLIDDEEENIVLEENILLGGENVLLQEEHVIMQEAVILDDEEVLKGANEGNIINKSTSRRNRRKSQQDNIQENNPNIDKKQTAQGTRQEEEDYKIVESEDNKIVLKRRRKSTPKALAWEEDRKARIARNRIAKKEAECENMKTRSRSLKENKKLNSIEDKLDESEVIDEEATEEIVVCDIINEIEIEAPSTPKSDIPILSPSFSCSPLINSLINSPIIQAPLFNPLLSVQTLNPQKLEKQLVVVLKPEDEIHPSLPENVEIENSLPPVKLDKRLVVMLKPEDEVKVAKHIRKLKAAKRPLRRIQSYKDYIKSKEKKEAKRLNEDESAYNKTKKNFSIISRDRRVKIKSPSTRNKKSPFEEEKKVTFKETKDIIETKECKDVKEVREAKVSKTKLKVKTKAELKDTSPGKAPLKSILKKNKPEEPDSPKKKLSLEEYINRTRVSDKDDGNIDKSKTEKIASKLDKIRILQGRKEEKKARSDEEDSIIKALRKMEEESSGNIFEDISEAQKPAQVEDVSTVLKSEKIEVKLDKFDRIEVKTDRFEAKSDRFEAKADIFEVNSAFTSPLRQYQKKKPLETNPHKYNEIKPHYGENTSHYGDVTPLFNEITQNTPQYNEVRYTELPHYNIVSPQYLEMTHYSYKDPRFKDGYCNKDPRKKDNYCQELYGENHYPNISYNREIVPPQYSAQYNEVISPYSEVTSPYSEAQVAPQYNVHHYNENVNYNTAMSQYGDYREVNHYNDTNYNYNSEAVPINTGNNYTELKSYYTKTTSHYNSENKHHYKEYSEDFTSKSKSPKKERRSTTVTSKHLDPRNRERMSRRNSDSKSSNYRASSKPDAVSEVIPNNKNSKQNLEASKQKPEVEGRQKQSTEESKQQPGESKRIDDQIIEHKPTPSEDKHKPDTEKLEVKQNLETCKQNLEASKQRLEASVHSSPSIKVIASCNAEASFKQNVEVSDVPAPSIQEASCKQRLEIEASMSNVQTSIQEAKVPTNQEVSDPRNQEASYPIDSEPKSKSKFKGEETETSTNEATPTISSKYEYLNSLGLYREGSPSPPLLERATNTAPPTKDKIEDVPPVLRREVLDFGLEEDEEELDFEEDISSSWPSPCPSKHCGNSVKVCEAINKDCETFTKYKASCKPGASPKDASNKICDASNTKNCDPSTKDCDACSTDCDSSIKHCDVSRNDCETLENPVQVQGPLDARNGSLRTNASSTTKSVFNEQKQIISDLNKKIDDIFMLTFRTSKYEDDLLKRFTNGERMAPGELLKVRNVIQRKNFKIQKPKAKTIINLDEISYRKTNVIDLNDFNLDVPLNKPKAKSIIDLNELLPAKVGSTIKEKSFNEEDRVPTAGLKVLGQPRYTTKIYRLSEDVTTIPKKPKMPILLPLSRKGRYDFDSNEGRHQTETNRRKYKRDPRSWKNCQKDDKKELVKTTRNKNHISIHPVWSRLQLSEEDGKGRSNHNKSHNNQERSAKYYEENCEAVYTKEIIRERRTKEESKLHENAKETSRIKESARKDTIKVFNKKEIASASNEESVKYQINGEIGKIQSPKEVAENREHVEMSNENTKGCREKCPNDQENIQNDKESTKEYQEHISDSTNGNQGNKIKADNLEETTKEIVINCEDKEITIDEENEQTEENKNKVEGNFKESESIPTESARLVDELENLNVLVSQESCTKDEIENVEVIGAELTSEETKQDLAETIQEQVRILENEEEPIPSEENSEDICVKRQKLCNFEDDENKFEGNNNENLIVAERMDKLEEACFEQQEKLADSKENKFKDKDGLEENMADNKLEEKMVEDSLEETIIEDIKLEDRMEAEIVKDKLEENKYLEEMQDNNLAKSYEDKLEEMQENRKKCFENKKLNVLQNYVLKTKCIHLNLNEEINHRERNSIEDQFNQEERLDEDILKNESDCQIEENINIEDPQTKSLNAQTIVDSATNLSIDPAETNCQSGEEKEEHSIMNTVLVISKSTKLEEEIKFNNHSFYKEQDETNIDSLQKETKQHSTINLDEKEETKMKHSFGEEEGNQNETNFLCKGDSQQEETETQHSSFIEDEHSIQNKQGHSVLWTNPKRERRSITVLKMMRRKQDADAEEILDITTPDEIQDELNSNLNQEHINSKDALPDESTSHDDSKLNYINISPTNPILNSKSPQPEDSGSRNDSKLNYVNFASKSVHPEESTTYYDSTLNCSNFPTKKQQISKVHPSNSITNSYLDLQPEVSTNLNLGYLDEQPESPKILNLSTKCNSSSSRELIIVSNKTSSLNELPINLCCNSSKNKLRDFSRDEIKLKQDPNVLNLKYEEVKLKHEDSHLKQEQPNLIQHELKLRQEVASLKREESNESISCLKLNVAPDQSIKQATLAARSDLNLMYQSQSNFTGNEESSPISNGYIDFSALHELNRRSQMSLLSQTRCESNRDLYYKKCDLNSSINRRPYLESLKTESARRRRESKNYKSKIRVNMMSNENNNSFRMHSDLINNSKGGSNTSSDSTLNFLESCKATRRNNTVIKYDTKQQHSISENIINNTSISESSIINEPNTNVTESNRGSTDSYISKTESDANKTTEEPTTNIPHAYFNFVNSMELKSNIFHANNLALNNTTLTPIPKESQNPATTLKPTRRRKSIFDSIQILSTGEPSSMDIVNRFNESESARVNNVVNTTKSFDINPFAIELTKKTDDAINGIKLESSSDVAKTESIELRAQEVSEEANVFRGVPILPAEVPSSLDLIGLESTARVNSVFKISEQLDNIPIGEVNILESTETTSKATDGMSHESSGSRCDSTSDFQDETKLPNKISCDQQEKHMQEKPYCDLQRKYDDLHVIQEKSYDLQPSEEKKTLLSPSVFNEELSICENVEVTSCDLKPRQLRKIPELVAIDRAKFMNPLRRVRKVHSALPVPSDAKRVRFEEPSKRKSIDDISRKLMDICKDNICKPEYESVLPSDDLKLHLKKVKKSRKRKRFRNLHAASSDEEADYSVFESKNPKGLPKLIIKRNVVEVREHFQPIVRIERDPKLDSMAKRKRKC